MVGLGRVELPTSPLSGVRSSHLSYRPVRLPNSIIAGGAGRDRTGDLLSANQALSQLSYSPMLYHSAIRMEKVNRGQLDAETTGPAHGRLSRTHRI